MENEKLLSMDLTSNSVYAGTELYTMFRNNEELQRMIYNDCDPYYTIVGGCLNIAQTLMVDAIEEIKKQGLYRQKAKMLGKLALARMEDELNTIKSALQIIAIYGKDSYQLWLDVTDKMQEILQPDMDKMFYAYDNYLLKKKKDKHIMLAKIYFASTFLYYCTERVYPAVARGVMNRAGLDMKQVFPNGDAKNIRKAWEGMEQIVAWHYGIVDFGEDANCRLAMDVLDNRLANDALYREAAEYGLAQNKASFDEQLQDAADKVVQICEEKGITKITESQMKAAMKEIVFQDNGVGLKKVGSN